jgi:DNA repair photolyase
VAPEVSYRESEAKSLLRKSKRVDSWFLSCCGMNLYRGCQHNCAYCDGRTEGYYVEGEFGAEVSVKTNAPQLLRRELDPARRRKPLRGGFVLLGGGVGDSYQPAEERYRLSRQALEILLEYGYPVHVLTKSTLVERDLDLIRQINARSRAILSFSFSSVDESISAVFEPGVPPPAERLATLARFRKEGIPCGLFLVPVIPFVTDGAGLMEEVLRRAGEMGMDFVICGGMTLKQGRQAQHFLRTLRGYRPELLPQYERIYPGDPWGQAAGGYYRELAMRFGRIAAAHGMPARMPLRLWSDLVGENDHVAVMLEHLDYFLRLQGKSSRYGYAAHCIGLLQRPVSQALAEGERLRGVTPATERLVREILERGTCAPYEAMLPGRG